MNLNCFILCILKPKYTALLTKKYKCTVQCIIDPAYTKSMKLLLCALYCTILYCILYSLKFITSVSGEERFKLNESQGSYTIYWQIKQKRRI